MRTHNICFCGEIKKIAVPFPLKKRKCLSYDTVNLLLAIMSHFRVCRGVLIKCREDFFLKWVLA